MAHEAFAAPRMPSHPPPTLEPASRFLRHMLATAAAEQDVLYTVYWLRQLRDRGLLWRCTKRGIEGALVGRGEGDAYPTALEAVATAKRSTLRNFILLLLLFNLEGSGKGWPLRVDTSGWQEWAQKIVEKWEYKWRGCEMAQHALSLLRMETDEEVADWIDANLPSPPNPEGLTGWREMPPFPPQAGQGSIPSEEAGDEPEGIKAEEQEEVKQEEREEVEVEQVKQEPSASPGPAPAPPPAAFSLAEEHKAILCTASLPPHPSPPLPPAVGERRPSIPLPSLPTQSAAPSRSTSPRHPSPRTSRLPPMTRPPPSRALPRSAAPSAHTPTHFLPLPPSAGLGPDHPIRLHIFHLPAETTPGDIAELFHDLGVQCSAIKLFPLQKYGSKCYVTVPDRASWAEADRLIRSYRVCGHTPIMERLHPSMAERFTPQHPTVWLEGFGEQAQAVDVERLARRTRCGLYGAGLEWAGDGKRGRVRASSPDTAERVCRMLDGVELPAKAGGGRVRASWRREDGGEEERRHPTRNREREGSFVHPRAGPSRAPASPRPSPSFRAPHPSSAGPYPSPDPSPAPATPRYTSQPLSRFPPPPSPTGDASWGRRERRRSASPPRERSFPGGWEEHERRVSADDERYERERWERKRWERDERWERDDRYEREHFARDERDRFEWGRRYERDDGFERGRNRRMGSPLRRSW